MHKIKTIRINCDSGEAELGKSYVITFDRRNTPSYGLMTWRISQCFFRAQLLHNEKLSKQPFHTSIIVDKEYLVKHKPADPENTIKRLEWYINNMLPPDIPMVFTIYVSNREDYTTIDDRSWLWPLKHQWSKADTSDYVTVQLPENHISPGGNEQRRGWEIQLEVFKHVCPHPIKFIGYSDPIDECYNLLKHTKFHFTYFGATYYLATMMGVPNIIMGYKYEERVANNWDTGEKITVEHSVWPLDRVIQLKDINKRTITHGVVNHFNVMSDVESLKRLMAKHE